jgi:hypothetical protein
VSLRAFATVNATRNCRINRQLKQPAAIINPKKRTRGIHARERWRRNYSEAARQNFFLFQHSYLAAYDFDSARKFCRTANMKTPAWRKWRAKLLAVMRTRVTLLNNWRAKLISLLLATTVWYLIKKNIETTPSPSGKFFPERVTETR